VLTLLDPALRSDAARRAAAKETFRVQRNDYAELHDLATAETIFLSRPEADWKLTPATTKALQDYFAKGWLKDVNKLTPAIHAQAAAWLGEQVAALRKTENVDALVLFAAGHLGHAAPGADFDKAVRSLGFTVQNGVAGTAEGFAVRDLDAWIATNDFDLAVLAYTKEFREIDSTAVRFVWAYALTCAAQAKKKGFDKAVKAFNANPVPAGPVKEHLAALAKSIQAVALCNTCGGEGKLRCTNCHGAKEVRFACQKCGGKGKIPPPGLVVPPSGNFRRFGRNLMNCSACKGTGYERVLRCEKCKDGFFVCKQCDGKQKSPPDFSDICEYAPCADCEGDGCIFRNVRWACPSCLGLGKKLTPKADTSKLLP
jgi:hypothetical protein